MQIFHNIITVILPARRPQGPWILILYTAKTDRVQMRATVGSQQRIIFQMHIWCTNPTF